ncbi:MAG: hypothetical protein D6696_17535 [Acidobacteria bacterium]|nr:MAG: hypothetical protein D6696_17535 [Acidobacteriota bacterium]
MWLLVQAGGGARRRCAGAALRRRLARGWLVAAACTALACGGDPDVASDVLLITVDTLRPDHLGLYGYPRPTSPNLDRFFAADRAAIFERAYSTAAHTSPSVVSILSGLYPHRHRVRLFFQLLPEETRLLPELLPGGFRSAGFVSNVVLTDEALGIAERFDHYDDFVDERESQRAYYERGARRTTDAALRWLRGRDAAERLFLWVHYIDPHGPYRPPADWRDRFDHAGRREILPAQISDYQREPGVTDGLYYVDRYDEEIAYADEQIGRLLDAWAVARPLDGTLVVFTADHGESMMEHERWFTHGYHVYEEIIRVPLMLRGVGVLPGRRAQAVSTIDLAPTVLRAVGAEVPPDMHGLDLRQPPPATPDRLLLATGGGGGKGRTGWLAGIQGGRKGILGLDEHGRVRESRTYRLDQDPGELSPLPAPPDDALVAHLIELAAADPDPGGVPLAARMGRELHAPKVAPGVSEENRERLKALGYVD